MCRLLPLLLCLSLLSACGYGLQGQQHADALEGGFELNGKAARGALGTEAEKALLAAGARVGSKGQWRLHLLGESIKRSVLSIDADGKAQQYLLVYQLRFRLDEQGRPLLRDESVTVEREVRHQSGQVLASELEQEQIEGELRSEAVDGMLRMILRRIDHPVQPEMESETAPEAVEPETVPQEPIAPEDEADPQQNPGPEPEPPQETTAEPVP